MTEGLSMHLQRIVAGFLCAASLFAACSSAPPVRTPHGPAESPPVVLREDAACRASGEALVGRYMQGDSLLKLRDAAADKAELEWFDRCAGPPHASLLLALSAWSAAKNERALGQVYDALHALDNDNGADIPLARRIAVLLALDTGVPKGQVLPYARSGCETGLAPLCPVAIDIAWHLGYPPDALTQLIPDRAGIYQDQAKELLALAYLNRGQPMAAAGLYARHNMSQNTAPAGPGLYATAVADPGAVDMTETDAACGRGDCWACATMARRGYDTGQPDIALASSEEACACGAGVACMDVARAMFDRGENDRGWIMLQQGCERDWGPACRAFGMRLLAKGGAEGAASHLERGCRLGDGASCVAYADAPRGEDDIRGLLLTACRRSRIGAACATLARRLETSGSMAPAREYASDACQLDDGQGCMQLAAMDRRNDAPKDALCALWQRACTLHTGDGCTRFGTDCAPENEHQDWFRRGCESGSGEGCRRHALSLTGPQAESLMLRACELGDSPACTTLKVSAMNPEALLQSCTAGAAQACFLLAKKAVSDGPVTPVAAGYAKTGCTAGIADSCLLAADIMTRLQDTGGALKAVKECCGTTGDMRCCASYGCMLTRRGDVPNALKILEKAWHSGEASAAACYGQALVQTGKPREAQPPLEASCARFGDVSCTRLARIIRNSDPQRALELARQRCVQYTDADACRMAGTMLFGQKSYAMALRMLKPIAASDPDAALMAGDAALALHEPSNAQPWFLIACRADRGRGCLEAADIAGDLSLYEKACTLGQARGCYRAALKYREKGMQLEADTYLKVGCGMDVTYCNPDNPPTGN